MTLLSACAEGARFSNDASADTPIVSDSGFCAINPCLNGGICSNGASTFMCTCPSGFTGLRCEQNVDECNPNPCMNGGTCADQNNTYICSCPPGFSGVQCEINFDDCSGVSCLNGGVCEDGANAFVCNCVNGYSGPNCALAPGNCRVIHNEAPSLPNGIYTIDPNGGTAADAFEVYCNMTDAGGGWTLISNRRAGFGSSESCGTNLRQFFTAGCGVVTAIEATNSYSLPASQRVLLGYTELAMIQYLNGTADVDDAYVVRGITTDLFPDTSLSTNIAVGSVCDINLGNCDTTNVFWKFIGDAWFHNARCLSGAGTGVPELRGNYGLCDERAANNGDVSEYPVSRLFGNRESYAEAKLWGQVGGAEAYQERLFVR